MPINVDVLLSSVPLLPVAEQSELFTKVQELRSSMLSASLARLIAAVNDTPIDKRVAKFIAMRDARAAENAAAARLDAQFKEALSAIENSLLRDAAAQGVSGFQTADATTYVDTRTLASIADDKAFFDFVRETGDLDFFERRIKATHIKEWQEANGGAVPPGLNVFRELTMKVRRR